LNETLTTQKQLSVARVLEDLRRRLMEIGTRNRLIHVNRNSRRSNVLNIVNERADDVFDILWVNGRKMRFKPIGTDDPDNDEQIVLAPPEEPDSERYTDTYLETPLGPDSLQKRLLRLAQEARVAEEEQGVNILYLAIGFLQWFEDQNSSVQREAPLILLPIDLVRNERTGRYGIRARYDELVANLPLQQRLDRDFGIRLPEIEIMEEEGMPWTPTTYFDTVTQAITSQPRWIIDRDGMQLGFFSFSKLLMLLDLQPENWSNEAITQNQLTQELLTGGFEPEPPLFPEDESLDRHLEPKNLLHVIDADASQTKAIEEVRAGRNIVIQGPPGTGKSQTITNIIAAAAHDGKRVLFVAEKMAALDVVYRNLVKTGLNDLCLELHSRKANKRAVLEELKRTLKARESAPATPTLPDELRKTRDKLNHIDEVLHTALPGCDYTPFEAMSEIVHFYSRGIEPPRLKANGFKAISQVERRRLAKFITDYISARERVEPVTTHPFCGVSKLDLQPTDLQRLDRDLTKASHTLDSLITTAGAAASQLGKPCPDTLGEVATLHAQYECLANAPNGARTYSPILYLHNCDSQLKEALDAGLAWRQMYDEIVPHFTEIAWTADAQRLRTALSKGVGSILYRLFGGYRSASREFGSLLSEELPRKSEERLALLDKLLAVQNQHAKLDKYEAHLSESLGSTWCGDQTDFAGLTEILTWLEAVHIIGLADNSVDLVDWIDNVEQPSNTAEQLAAKTEAATTAIHAPLERLGLVGPKYTELSGLSINDLRERITGMQNAPDLYAYWCHFAKSREQLIEAGLSELVELIETGTVSSDRAIDEFNYAVAEVRWQAVREISTELVKLVHFDRHQLVDTFKALDKTSINVTRQLIRAKHLSQLPQGAVGEMGFLRGEMAKKRGHRSIRKIMETAGGMVQRIKPVLLMSPISIAQFLPPGKINFDILIIDEASQVRPEDAIGATARVKQIVVVGDQKQLPPTTFFDRVTGSTDDTDEETDEGSLPVTRPGELESILTLCEARGMRQTMLEWHYRSRDPSLIAVSNIEFYKRLILPPSPLQNSSEYGLSFNYVNGIYTSRHVGTGRPGTNRIEAQAVVDAMSKHAERYPSYSLGVVAFSKAQSDMINQLLDRDRRQNPHLDAFLREGKQENTFVKNIENVQGDERDVILISVGYGPESAESRHLRMQFGPVNNEGGERRLNVLFTRSRLRCEVFASFDPGDIDLSRITKQGPRVLKRFLEYAKTGDLGEQIISGEAPDSPFEQDVAEVIGSLGYMVDPQVGTAGFRIDLGVRNPSYPGEYLLAVECDGATYHSALWARERDRHRQEVLEEFGWRFHRIWSTDWFYRRGQEIERLRQAILEAEDNTHARDLIVGANANAATPPHFEKNDDSMQNMDETNLTLPNPPCLSASSYQRANFSVEESLEPHDLPTRRLSQYVIRVVEIEGPVHITEIARRIATIFGKSRTGRRINEATLAALNHAKRDGGINSDDSFWFTDAQAAEVPVRDRSAESYPTTKAEYLSPMEIRAAADWIKQESGEVTEDELVRSVARLLGFHRVGQDLQAQIRSNISI